jgi:glycerol-3-phosphate dehydrogenase
LRPLIADPHGKPSEISRSHQIRNPEPGWWDVAGGKLTTYRLMAEQTVDRIVKWLNDLNGLNRLNGSNRQFRSCQAATEALLPLSQVEGISGILPPEFCRSAVEHYCAEEWAIHLDDVMLRRTRWHYYFANARQMAEQVAHWMSEFLGWSEVTRRTELERYFRAVDYREASGSSERRGPEENVTNRRVRHEVHS